MFFLTGVDPPQIQFLTNFGGGTLRDRSYFCLLQLPQHWPRSNDELLFPQKYIEQMVTRQQLLLLLLLLLLQQLLLLPLPLPKLANIRKKPSPV